MALSRPPLTMEREWVLGLWRWVISTATASPTSLWPTKPVSQCCWAKVMAPSKRLSAPAWERFPGPWQWVTSTVTAGSIWPWRRLLILPIKSPCCWAGAMALSTPPRTTGLEQILALLLSAISTATANPTWRWPTSVCSVATIPRAASQCCWATATAHSSPPSITPRAGIPVTSWQATSTPTANSTWP